MSHFSTISLGAGSPGASLLAALLSSGAVSSSGSSLGAGSAEVAGDLGALLKKLTAGQTSYRKGRPLDCAYKKWPNPFIARTAVPGISLFVCRYADGKVELAMSNEYDAREAWGATVTPPAGVGSAEPEKVLELGRALSRALAEAYFDRSCHTQAETKVEDDRSAATLDLQKCVEAQLFHLPRLAVEDALAASADVARHEADRLRDLVHKMHKKIVHLSNSSSSKKHLNDSDDD